MDRHKRKVEEPVCCEPSNEPWKVVISAGDSEYEVTLNVQSSWNTKRYTRIVHFRAPPRMLSDSLQECWIVKEDRSTHARVDFLIETQDLNKGDPHVCHWI